MSNFAMRDNWSTQMPKGCPPENADIPDGKREYYRIVATIPPTDKDYLPMVEENPKRAKQFEGKRNELLTYGLSLFDNIDGVKKAIKQMGGRKKYVVGITLKEDDGVILQTSEGHWTWWKTNSFNANDYKEVEL